MAVTGPGSMRKAVTPTQACPERPCRRLTGPQVTLPTAPCATRLHRRGPWPYALLGLRELVWSELADGCARSLTIPPLTKPHHFPALGAPLPPLRGTSLIRPHSQPRCTCWEAPEPISAAPAAQSAFLHGSPQPAGLLFHPCGHLPQPPPYTTHTGCLLPARQPKTSGAPAVLQ